MNYFFWTASERFRNMILQILVEKYTELMGKPFFLIDISKFLDLKMSLIFHANTIVEVVLFV